MDSKRHFKSTKIRPKSIQNQIEQLVGPYRPPSPGDCLPEASRFSAKPIACSAMVAARPLGVCHLIFKKILVLWMNFGRYWMTILVDDDILLSHWPEI